MAGWAACGVVGDEFGEVMEQVGWSGGTVVCLEARVVQGADGGVEAFALGMHDDGVGGTVEFVHDDAVARRRARPAGVHAGVGSAVRGLWRTTMRSATVGPGRRCRSMSSPTGSRCPGRRVTAQLPRDGRW